MSFGEPSKPIGHSEHPDQETTLAGILAGIQADYFEFFCRIFPALKSFLDQPRFPNAESVVLKGRLTCFFRYFSSLHTTLRITIICIMLQVSFSTPSLQSGICSSENQGQKFQWNPLNHLLHSFAPY
jgi:hypothetical protein